MLHTHRFGIGDPDAVASLIEKLESTPAHEMAPRLGRAIRAAEARAIELELSPHEGGERDLAFYHGLLTGYAVALRISADASCASAIARGDAPVVVALLPGSIEAAARAARELKAPLDVVAVRTVTAPGGDSREVAAVTEGGFAVIDPRALERSDVDARTLGERLERLAVELTRSVGRLRADADPVPVRGRVIILVTDRPATGLTALAAERMFLERGAARVYCMAPAAGLEDALMAAHDAERTVATFGG